MDGFDAEKLAKLKELGLFSDEQEQQQKKDREKKEAREQSAQKQELQAMANRPQQYRRRGGQYPRSNRFSAPASHRPLKPYGEERDAAAMLHPAAIATAPYNFVPLPEAVLPSPLDDLLRKQTPSEAFHTYLTSGKHLSGRIDLDIETLTALFIGGSGDKNTFAPAGREIIPGSELRGMVKNIFHILTCSTWHGGEDTTDRHLYYRCLMAPKSMPQNVPLHDSYAAKMTDGATNRKKALPGFLVKRRGNWYLYPLLEGKLHSIAIWKYLDMFRLSASIYQNDLEKSCVRWDENGTTAYIQTGIRKNDLKKIRMSDEALATATPEDRRKWGKQYYKKLSPQDIDRSNRDGLKIPDQVIEDYRSDKNRHGVDLLKEAGRKDSLAPKNIEGIPAFDGIAPCFYLLDSNGDVKSFGHGQSYRIPYDNSVMDAIPAEVKQDLVDFTAAVFGRSGRTSEDASWASRVMFDDAAVCSTVRTEAQAESHILVQPNPTSFQLYLEQNDSEQLVHWDASDAPQAPESRPKIRGYKMYWHSPANHDWRATDFEKDINRKRSKGSQPLLKTITPLHAGVKFSGAIRFRDLTPVELGALLKVFFLAENDEDIAFKIGMGKSIGLGSIRITPRLHIEDGSRYQKLFDGDTWHTSVQDDDGQTYIDAFEHYVHTARNGKAVQSYEAALSALRRMLDFRSTKLAKWEHVTAPMDGDTMPEHRDQKPTDTRFQHRNILPDAASVLAHARKPS